LAAGRIERLVAWFIVRFPQDYRLVPGYPQVCGHCARFRLEYANSGHDSFGEISREKTSAEKDSAQKSQASVGQMIFSP
jgi:hypothetical protein